MRMMNAQDVILKAMSGQYKWWEAAEILRIKDRTMAAMAAAVREARL
jgi:hypothetical protein